MNKPLLPIDIGGTGSGSGISHWKGIYSCGLRAAMDEVSRKVGKPTSSDNEDTFTGTVGHALLATFFGGNPAFDTRTLEYSQMPAIDRTQQCVETAEAVFRHYRMKHKPNCFGKVLSVEEPFELPEEGRPAWLPRDMRLTAGLDLVVKMTKSAAANLFTQHKLKLEVGGLYIVDHKFPRNITPNNKLYYDTEIQFPWYMLAYEIMSGKKVDGLLVNAIGRTKPYKEKVFLMGPPTEKDQTMVAAFLSEAKARHERGLLSKRVPANPLSCTSFGRPCAYLNKCSRS